MSSKRAGVARTSSSRISQVFKTYDRSGDGYLDISELETVLKTLGSFNSHEVGAICAALDTSKDGQVSYDEFLEWVTAPADSKELMKAKAILAPNDDDGMKVVFYNFCGAGKSDMDGRAFTKMCRDCNLVDKSFTETDIDLVFSSNKVKAKGQRTIGVGQFEAALGLVAAKKGVSLDAVREVVLEATRPVLQGTKADAVRFYDDSKSMLREESMVSEMSSTRRGSLDRRRRSRDFARLLSESEKVPEGEERQADNRNLWKTFGIDLPAGRMLKRLYEPPYRPEASLGIKRKPGRLSTRLGQDVFIATNSLQAVTPGLHFRRSKHMQDLCRGPDDFIAWGSAVQGELVDACWLKVGDRFLPAEVNGVRLLRRWDGAGQLPNGQLFKANSLPALHSPPKHSEGSRFLVGLGPHAQLGPDGHSVRLSLRMTA